MTILIAFAWGTIGTTIFLVAYCRWIERKGKE